jgi:hypothetical protein
MSDTKLTGALFRNKKKESKKHPDFLGVLNINRDMARQIFEKFKATDEKELKIQVSGWWKAPKDRDKDEYVSLSGDFGVAKSEGRDRERGRDDRGGSRDSRDTRSRDDRGRDDGRRTPDFDDEIPF